jgi:alkylation response protein AidB-like acyl-CoA dehydrogenase
VSADLSTGRPRLRYKDFSLADDQIMVIDTFKEFFEKKCPSSLVRENAATGFSPGLWAGLAGMGVASMALPVAAGGDGAGLVEAVLVAEQAGAVLAPIPLASHVAASRLLGRLGVSQSLLAGALTGERIFTLALAPAKAGTSQLVPDASISRDIIAFDGADLSLYTSSSPCAHVPNQAGGAIGWWQPGGSAQQTMLATGHEAAAAFRRAVAEWRVLMAASLVGLTQSALRIAVEFAKTRETMGVPIGTLQGVSFPLADVEIGTSGARNLVRKAAWLLEESPDERPELPVMAHAYARELAGRGVSIAAHVQGGLGVSCEADVTLFFTRAKAWGAMTGRISDDYVLIAREYAATV